MKARLIVTALLLVSVFSVVAYGEEGECQTCLDGEYLLQPAGGDTILGVSPGITPVGKLKILVVFAMIAGGGGYADTCFAWPPALGDTLPSWAETFVVNDSTAGDFPVPSMNDYYFEMSRGDLIVYGQVYPRVVISNIVGPDYPQSEPADTVAHRMTDILTQVATDPNFDLSEFDRYRYCGMPDSFETDTDGFVDMILVLGRKGCCGMSQCIPSFCSAESLAVGGNCNQDTLWTDDSTYVNGSKVPLKIHHYRTCQVQSAGHPAYSLAGLAHELGHHLSACGTGGCFGVALGDPWRIGAYGVGEQNWHRGMCMSALERAGLGWMDVDTVSTNTLRLKVPDSITSGRCFLVPIQHTDTCNDSTAFFLIENRQWTTWYTCGLNNKCGGRGIASCDHVEPLPGEGLLLWHMDRRAAYSGCATAGKPFHMIDVECADGLFDWGTAIPDPVYGMDSIDSVAKNVQPPWLEMADSTDLFGSHGSNAFTPYTNPSTNNWWYNPNRIPSPWPWVQCGKWEQSVPTGISFTNIEEGAEDTMLVDIRFETPSDTITTDTHWAKWMILGGDLTVADGCTLTIDPGATISFVPTTDYEAAGMDTSLVELTALGDIKALGTSTDSIYFRPAGIGRGHDPEPGDWYGLRIRQQDTMRTALDYCRIDYGTMGVSYFSPPFPSPSFTDNGYISNCTISDNYEGGAYYAPSGYYAQSVGLISNCTIERNGTDSNGFGICSDRTHLKILSNKIRHNSSIGVDIKRATDVTVYGNTINQQDVPANLDAYGIRLDTPPTTGLRARVSNNTIKYCNQAGIRVGSGLSHAAHVTIDSTTVMRCTVGLEAHPGLMCMTDSVIVYASTFKYDSVAVYCDSATYGSTAGVVLGVDSTGVGGFNTFQFDTVFVFKLGPDSLTAEVNWWGSNPPNSAKFIGAVDYVPYLTAKPSQGQEAIPGNGQPPNGIAGDEYTLALHPNPAAGDVAFSIRLACAAAVKLEVFDVRGRLVTTLVDGPLPAGMHELVWQATDAAGGRLATGVYFCRVKVEGETRTLKIVLLG